MPDNDEDELAVEMMDSLTPQQTSGGKSKFFVKIILGTNHRTVSDAKATNA